MKFRSAKFLITVGLVVGAMALLIITATGESGYATDYYHTTSEFLARADEYVGRQVRVNGIVSEGSIQRTPATPDRPEPLLVFTLDDPQTPVPVRYTGTTVPDAFREGANTVVAGIYTSDSVLEARQLLVKCPSKYEAADASTGE